MRLSYALLVFATPTLFAGNTVTASGHSTDVSTMASPDLDGASQIVRDEKKSLRYLNDADLDGNNGEERRFTNLFRTDKIDAIKASLSRAKNGDAGGIPMVEKRFTKWVKQGYTPSNLPSVLKAEKYKLLRQNFRSWKYHHHLVALD
ncbi:hypothetical protein PHMEG_00021178 [Phytophthora megakarya]|uniref:RxLR effector protein n=1 Tax=Phytophthora megakarya TaxID=4795 RepID=A0A225VPT0_9STRA|nr:hypothetical protein PHMEG_00021178 [Phytophthora megakarya]